MFIWYIHCRASPYHPASWRTVQSESPTCAILRPNESIFLVPGTLPLEEAFA